MSPQPPCSPLKILGDRKATGAGGGMGALGTQGLRVLVPTAGVSNTAPCPPWGVRFYNKIMHIVNITRRAGEYCYRNTLHVEAGQAGTRTQCCCQEMELTERRVALGKIVFVFAFKSCESDAAH